MTDPVVLRQIAAQSRPMIVFDEKESILADLGAGQFIKNITVNRGKVGAEELPTSIDVDFSTLLSTAPLLTPLHTDEVTVFSERGKGYLWRFRLEYQTTVNPVDGLRKYRLELLR